MEKIKFLIKKITEKPKISEGLRKIDIKKVVEKILGKNLIKYVDEIHVKDKKLIIKLNSSSLRSELSYSKEKLIKNINDHLKQNDIEEIMLN